MAGASLQSLQLLFIKMEAGFFASPAKLSPAQKEAVIVGAVVASGEGERIETPTKSSSLRIAQAASPPSASFKSGGFSSPMMQLLGVPQCALSKKIPELRESDDKIFDDMKQQQRLAMVETLDMLHAHTHIRGSVRDYAQGLLTAQSQERVALMEDHFVTSPVNFGKVDEDYIAGCIVKHTQLSWQMVSKCRAFDSQFVRKFWQVLMNAA